MSGYLCYVLSESLGTAEESKQYLNRLRPQGQKLKSVGWPVYRANGLGWWPWLMSLLTRTMHDLLYA